MRFLLIFIIICELLLTAAPIPINNSTQVITPDITTENGVLHVIDSVLPEKLNITDGSETACNHFL